MYACEHNEMAEKHRNMDERTNMSLWQGRQKDGGRNENKDRVDGRLAVRWTCYMICTNMRRGELECKSGVIGNVEKVLKEEYSITFWAKKSQTGWSGQHPIFCVSSLAC